MAEEKRKINIVKPGKHYVGHIAIPSAMFRTLDYFNRPHMMRRIDNQTTLDNYIQIHDVEIAIDGKWPHARLGIANVRVFDIIFFWDELEDSGNESERKRAASYSADSGRAELNRATILTPMYDSQFYEIAGDYFGRFKRALSQNFIALNNATVDQTHLEPDSGQWAKKSISLPHGFVAVNMNYVDSYFLKFEE